jgi:hypothetical protein
LRTGSPHKALHDEPAPVCQPGGFYGKITDHLICANKRKR